MEFINPPGRTVEASVQPRTCVCSLDLHNTARNFWGHTSCNNCNCICAHGSANHNANRDQASNRRHM